MGGNTQFLVKITTNCQSILPPICYDNNNRNDFVWEHFENPFQDRVSISSLYMVHICIVYYHIERLFIVTRSCVGFRELTFNFEKKSLNLSAKNIDAEEILLGQNFNFLGRDNIRQVEILFFHFLLTPGHVLHEMIVLSIHP